MTNPITKVLLLFLVLFLSEGIMAQTTTKKPAAKSKTTKTKTTTKVKTTPVAMTVKLTSKCERNLMIFAGPKAQLREPKQRQVGGLSVNMLYIKTGDVVCIMDAKKKPVACANVTKATPALEINFAGTAIVTP